MKRLAFVILTWNSQQYIDECLQAVYETTSQYDVHVWVIDNGSNDKTIDMLLTLKKDLFKNRLHLVRNEKNLGTSKARNLALHEIQQMQDTDYIAIIDSDTKINVEAINLLAKALEQDDKVLIAAPRMHNNKGEMQISSKHFPTFKIKFFKAMPIQKLNQKGEQLECYSFDYEHCANMSRLYKDKETDHSGRVYAVDFSISACWLIKAKTLDIIGLLDEKIFYSPEDVDYCARVHEAGYQVVLVHDALIKHHTQRLSKRKFFSIMNLHHLKGLIYFYFKHRGKLIR